MHETTKERRRLFQKIVTALCFVSVIFPAVSGSFVVTPVDGCRREESTMV